MKEEMVKYLNNEVFSSQLKTTLLNLIEKKRSKVALVLNHILQNLENDFLPQHNEYMAVESIRMIDFKKEGDNFMLSFLALGKEPEFENNIPTNKNRQQGKIGKIIKNFITPYSHLIGIVLSAVDIEEFVNNLKANLNKDNIKFELVSGKDISKYYLYSNYADFSTSNTLHNSCMKYEECQDYFDIYTKNPNCELLVMFDSDVDSEKIVARAIVWNKDGQKYVDRRYYMLDMYHTEIIDYVKSQKWAYKKHNTYDDYASMIFMCPGENNNYIESDVELTYSYNNSIEEFPYSDTVKYYKNGTLTNNCCLLNNFWKLSCTGGGYECYGDDDCDYVECEYCGCSIYDGEEHRYRGRNYCEDCIVETYNGEIIPRHIAEPVYDITGEVFISASRLAAETVAIDGKYYLKPEVAGTSLLEKVNFICDAKVKLYEQAGIDLSDEYILAKSESELEEIIHDITKQKEMKEAIQFIVDSVSKI